MWQVLVGALALAVCAPMSRADSVMDGVNMGATPSGDSWYATDVGWFYTPSFSYQLTGVETRFSSLDSRLCTLEFFRVGPPSDPGSVLLRSSPFAPSTSWAGGTFAPLALTAGTTYFVGIRNTQWLGVNATNDPGATVWSPLRWDYDNSGSYAAVESGRYTSQPILRFRGPDAIPEAGTLTALMGLLSGGGLLILRRRK
jgi:hypothetical protein